MPNIESLLSAEFPSNAASTLHSTSRQNEVVQLTSPTKGHDSTAVLPPRPSNYQGSKAHPVSRQDAAALYNGNVSPDTNELLLPNPKGYEIIDTRDSSNSTSTNKASMLAVANMLIQLAGES